MQGDVSTRLLTLTTAQVLFLRVRMNTKGLGCISSSEVDHLFSQYLATAFWLKNTHDAQCHQMTWHLIWCCMTTFFQSDSNFSLQVQESLILRTGGLSMLPAQGCGHCCQTHTANSSRLLAQGDLSIHSFGLLWKSWHSLKDVIQNEIPKVTFHCSG